MDWKIARRTIPLDRPLVMGILNVTPDSFSDGGKFTDPRVANIQAGIMLEAGAAIVDVGRSEHRVDDVAILGCEVAAPL